MSVGKISDIANKLELYVTHDVLALSMVFQ